MDEVLYRIIDANFNRAREALRVMEEYCRFGLNDAGLSGRAKQMRHRLCEAIGRFDAIKLLGSRDTEGDVGRQMQVEGQLRRTSLEDCFTAGAKRASEAFRALAEASQGIDAEVSSIMEQLRFQVYAMEKDTVFRSYIRQKLEGIRLYVLVNAGGEMKDHDVLELAGQCLSGRADCLQLRAKNMTDTALLALAQRFTELCRKHSAVSIINDRADIAVLAEADGVHLGQDDLAVQDARRLSRRPLIIGVSTHNPQELEQAIASGCDYVGVGPAFASPTKPHVRTAGLEYLSAAARRLEGTGIYPAAIGGIDESNLQQVIKAGIKCVAVSSCVSRCSSPEAYCRVLKDRILQF